MFTTLRSLKAFISGLTAAISRGRTEGLSQTRFNSFFSGIPGSREEKRKSRFLIALVEVLNASVILAYAQFLHTTLLGRDAVLA